MFNLTALAGRKFIVSIRPQGVTLGYIKLPLQGEISICFGYCLMFSAKELFVTQTKEISSDNGKQYVSLCKSAFANV